MPGRFVYWMNVSLDLRIERTAGDSGGGDWLRIGESLHREFNARAERLAVLVQGRVVYEIMESFWPAARTDETLPDFLREYGDIWSDKPKYLVSRTRTSAGCNTGVIGGPDAIEQLAQLRARTEGDVGIGGANLATQLLHAGLLDEMLLFTHPVVLGRGRSLFDPPTGQVDCDLLEQRSFEDGVTLHRWAIRDARPVGRQP